LKARNRPHVTLLTLLVILNCNYCWTDSAFRGATETQPWARARRRMPVTTAPISFGSTVARLDTREATDLRLRRAWSSPTAALVAWLTRLYVRKSPLGSFKYIASGLVCCRWEVIIEAAPVRAGSTSIPAMDDAVRTAGGDVDCSCTWRSWAGGEPPSTTTGTGEGLAAVGAFDALCAAARHLHVGKIFWRCLQCRRR